MKKILLACVAALALAGAAYGQSQQLSPFQPGYRLPDGDKLNKMLNTEVNLAGYAYQLITSAQAAYTYTVPNNIGTVIWDIAAGVPSSSGNISQVTITAPANPFDGQRILIASKVVITTFAFVANTGQTLAASTPTVLTPSTTASQPGYEWIYNQATASWFRLQ